MSELRKANTEGKVYFLTLTVVLWIDIFTRKEYCQILIESLRFCQKNKGLELYAFCIMPSHVHLVASRKEELLSDLLRDMKSFVAKEIIKKIDTGGFESRREWLLHLFKFNAKYNSQNSTYMFWQKTSHPLEIISPEMMRQKIRYVEENPLGAGRISDGS